MAIRTALLEAFDAFLEDFESPAEREAAKLFWTAARDRQIDENAFHTAYDAELAALGLDDIFDSEGKLKHKGVYGKIKEAKVDNPDSWAVKAAAKLWALAYVDFVPYKCDAARRAEAEANWEREQAKRQAEKEAAEAKRRALLDAWTDCIVPAIEALPEKIVNRYATAVGSDIEAACEFRAGDKNSIYFIFRIPGGSSYYKKTISADMAPSVEKLTEFLTSFVSTVGCRASNLQIDICNVNTVNGFGDDIRFILLGESGVTYYVVYSANRGNIVVSETGFLMAPFLSEIQCLADMPEAYKVIYTCVSKPSNNRYTIRDSVSEYYYSWDSAETDKLGKYAPKIGTHKQTWSESNVEAVSSPDKECFSRMDNIDSWAQERYVSYATD